MTRTLPALLLLLVGPAWAGPSDGWMPAVPDCTVTGEALERAVQDALVACDSRRTRDACMADAGWEPAADGERPRYERFCALTARLLDRDDEDPPVVVASPMPATTTAMSTPR